MANPNTTPDPPPSLSAAELRRRLMSSTPPPMAGGLTAAEQEALPGFGPDALARLRLPGQPTSPAGSESTARGGIGARLAALDAASPSSIAAPPGSGARPYAGRPDGSGSGTRGYATRTVPEESGNTAGEVARFRNENKELRSLLDEMKHLLQEASDHEQVHATREKELEALLAEKQRQNDELNAQMQLIEDQIQNGTLGPQMPVVVPKTRTEVEEWADELERDSTRLQQDRKKLEGERRQLREDEEASENQMRGMEVGMARERALMARQETELKRLSAEIQHELELMQRGDVQLRDQMQKFQRRAQDVMQPKPGALPGAPPRR